MRGLVPASSLLKSSHEGTGRRDCPTNIHAKRFEEQVAGICPRNSNWLEFVGLVTGTKVGPCD